MRDARSGPRRQGVSRDARWHAALHAHSRATRPLPLGNRAVEQPLDREDHPHLVLFHPHLAPSCGGSQCRAWPHLTLPGVQHMCVYMCACACVRACVRACVCACVRAFCARKNMAPCMYHVFTCTERTHARHFYRTHARTPFLRAQNARTHAIHFYVHRTHARTPFLRAQNARTRAITHARTHARTRTHIHTHVLDPRQRKVRPSPTLATMYVPCMYVHSACMHAHIAYLHNTGILHIHDAYMHAFIYQVLPCALFTHSNLTRAPAEKQCPTGHSSFKNVKTTDTN
jgi:hypothetical protein